MLRAAGESASSSAVNPLITAEVNRKYGMGKIIREGEAPAEPRFCKQLTARLGLLFPLRGIPRPPGKPRPPGQFLYNGKIMKLLVVEDEPKTAAYLQKGLQESGFILDVADNGEDGLHLARSSHYDLIILDVMLPRRDGWSVLSELRKTGSATPVLFLTARDSVQDRVQGLEGGADDYLVKPFAC